MFLNLIQIEDNRSICINSQDIYYIEENSNGSAHIKFRDGRDLNVWQSYDSVVFALDANNISAPGIGGFIDKLVSKDEKK